MSRIFITIFLIGMLGISQAHAAGTDTTAITNVEDKNFVAGKKAIDAKRWTEAVELFNKVVAADANNADAHNYLAIRIAG
jgi:Flp pilus assembly protein TadD